MSSNVTEFDSNWSYNGKPITYFIGIELCAFFPSPYNDYDKHERRLFSLMNEKFTPQNLRKKLKNISLKLLNNEFILLMFILDFGPKLSLE